MEAKVLTAQSLCKRYGTLDALDHVDLTLEPGHIYGLIGRNGAGKTTLLSALTAPLGQAARLCGRMRLFWASCASAGN